MTFEEYVEQSQGAGSASELERLFASYLKGEGYENYVVASISAGKLVGAVWHEFPQDYAETYQKEGWASSDPVLAHSLAANRAFRWQDAVPQSSLSKNEAAVLRHCRELKVHSGMTFPLQRTQQLREVISISKRDDHDTDPSRIFILEAVCSQTWWRFTDLNAQTNQQVEPPKLTPRQLEMLSWVKHGKSNPEIAEILGISTKTVEYHLGQTMDRLRASNRITAVVIAIQHGLLSL